MRSRTSASPGSSLPIRKSRAEDRLRPPPAHHSSNDAASESYTHCPARSPASPIFCSHTHPNAGKSDPPTPSQKPKPTAPVFGLQTQGSSFIPSPSLKQLILKHAQHLSLKHTPSPLGIDACRRSECQLPSWRPH